MIEYVILSLVKVLDNIIGTAKSICVYNEKKMLSSILVVISQLIFYMVVSQVISDNSLTVIILVSIASGLGNFIAMAINDKIKPDDKWTMILTSSNIEDVKKLCNYLTSHKIKHISNDGYTREWEHTINIIAFSKTKDQSRLIENYIKNTEIKYLKEVI